MQDASSNQAAGTDDLDAAQLIADRRDLHRHPEMAYLESRTAAIVAARLSEYGYEVKKAVGRTGVVGLLRGSAAPAGPAARTLLYRADMDALPIAEENQIEYRSQNENVMHACGHDAHVAIALAVAKRMASLRDQIAGNLKLAFQPAEERGSGAVAMIDDGVLENPLVDAAVGLHVWNNLPSGQVGIYAGPMMAACDEFELTVLGRGGHGAMPHQTVDAILAGSQVVNALQTVVSRNVSPLDSAVVTVGKFVSGTAFNIIAGSAVLTGTVRTFDQGTYRTIPGIFERVVRGVTESLGASYTLRYDRHTPPVVNDAEMCALVAGCSTEVVGSECVIQDRSVPTMGSEDMAYFLERVPGCFFFLGTRNESRGFIHPHHSPKFDIDEEALPAGVEIMTRVISRYLS